VLDLHEKVLEQNFFESRLKMGPREQQGGQPQTDSYEPVSAQSLETKNVLKTCKLSECKYV